MAVCRRHCANDSPWPVATSPLNVMHWPEPAPHSTGPWMCCCRPLHRAAPIRPPASPSARRAAACCRPETTLPTIYASLQEGDEEGRRPCACGGLRCPFVDGCSRRIAGEDEQPLSRGWQHRARRHPPGAHGVAVAASRRLHCGAQPGVASRTRCVHFVTTLKHCDESVHEARCARRLQACAPRATHRALPGPGAAAAATCMRKPSPPCAGALGVAAGWRAQRARELTRRDCLNVEPVGREVSWRRGRGLSTAGQSAQPTVEPKRRGLPGPGFAAPQLRVHRSLSFSCAPDADEKGADSDRSLGDRTAT